MNDFFLPAVDEVQHGKRFGTGVYLADSLDKSLTYAPEDDGIRFVLLCRMACGETLYTEELEDVTACTRACQNKKDSVIADPNAHGIREFIALQEEQIYPEYLLELAAGPPPPPRPISPILAFDPPEPPDEPFVSLPDPPMPVQLDAPS